MVLKDEDVWASVERVLAEIGWERTRENFLRASYDVLPEEWSDEEEEQHLPPDLRLVPAPPTPLLH